MSASDAGLVAAMAALAGVVGSITIVRVASGGYRKVTTIGLLVVLGLSLCAVIVAEGPWRVAAVLIEGFCAGAIMPLMLNMLMEMPQIGPSALGAASGLYFAVGEMGGFLGPSLMGFVAETTGSFSWGILIFALIIWLMLLPASRLHEAEISGSQQTRRAAAS
jgi:MFS family permease